MENEAVAIMQPYIFPYIGYFQLVDACDYFVFYDDVNYIKGGWVSRNKILSQGSELMFSVPVVKASQNRLIKDVVTFKTNKWAENFCSQLHHSYSKAPFYSDVSKMVLSVFDRDTLSVSRLASESVLRVCEYLDLEITCKVSSECFSDSRGEDKADRLINITRSLGCRNYINLPGGREIYTKNYFKEKGVSLRFVESNQVAYKQFGNEFIANLSIIDVLMFNDKDRTRQLLSNYTLV